MIKVEIDPNAPIYSEGDSLLDRVVSEVASMLLRDSALRDVLGDLRERIRQVRDKAIQEAVTPLVQKALAASVQPTDLYGTPKGEPVTLSEVIVQEATKLLKGPSSRHNREGSIAEQIIRTEVNAALGRELKKAVDESRAQVVAAVQEKGAEVLAKTIREMAR